MSILRKKDYLEILRFYNINSFGLKLGELRDISNKILANKLCRCIKKVNSANETKSISICKNSILTKKNLKVGHFKCNKGSQFIPNKTNKQTLSKINSTRKNLFSRVNKIKSS